jgi:hypothetical protein
LSVTQKWAVVLHLSIVAPNLANGRPSRARAAAGEKLYQIVVALRGFNPGAGFGKMNWRSIVAPLPTGDGYINYPVVFGLPLLDMYYL